MYNLEPGLPPDIQGRLYFYSGHINPDEIDTSTGNHDELLDWAFPDDNPVLAEAEAIVRDAFKGIVSLTINPETHVSSEQELIISPQMTDIQFLEALGQTAANLGNN